MMLIYENYDMPCTKHRIKWSNSKTKNHGFCNILSTATIHTLIEVLTFARWSKTCSRSNVTRSNLRIERWRRCWLINLLNLFIHCFLAFLCSKAFAAWDLVLTRSDIIVPSYAIWYLMYNNQKMIVDQYLSQSKEKWETRLK